MDHQLLAALPGPLALPKEVLLHIIRQSRKLAFQKDPQVAHRRVALVEAEQPQIAEAATHQDPLLLQAPELSLRHVQPKPEGAGDALAMAFPVALQKQQDTGRGAVAEKGLQHRVQVEASSGFHSVQGSKHPYYEWNDPVWGGPHLWLLLGQSLRQLMAVEGKRAVPYSFRHSYSLRGHRLDIDAGAMTHSMGHSLEVHLRSYPWAAASNTAAAFERAGAARRGQPSDERLSARVPSPVMPQVPCRHVATGAACSLQPLVGPVDLSGGGVGGVARGAGLAVEQHVVAGRFRGLGRNESTMTRGRRARASTWTNRFGQLSYL